MATQSILSLSMVEPDIAALTLDDPQKGANVLSSEVLQDLERHLDELGQRRDLAGLIIRSGKPGVFIAGANVREFTQWMGTAKAEVAAFARRGQLLFSRLSKLPFVTVAAIDGFCLGGGAELAIWCDRRVMGDNPKCQFGFPEVKLGLIPGWGGTARTPRMIGLSNAVELVSGGESVDAREAYKQGLAIDLARSERLMEAAISLVRNEQKSGQYQRDRERWAGSIDMDETELAFLGATFSAYIQQKTDGNYPAPQAALELMLEAASADLETACQREAETFAEVFGSPVNRALLNVFFLQDDNKKDPGVARKDIVPQRIKSVSVIGAGIMGQGIAGANVRKRIPVALADAAPAALAAGVSAILQEVSYNKATKGPDARQACEMAPLVNGTTSDEELAASDLVIEAVIEKPDVKQAVYGRLERLLRPEAILASNTSTIPITQLAASLTRPQQFCGVHFFNPVRQMPLVEVIRGEQTSDETVATAVAYVKQLGKTPVVVKDGPGFLVNRLLFPYMNEALELLAQGAAIRHVEKAAKVFGMPMGPITLFDVVGLDVAMYAGQTLQQAWPDRVIQPSLLVALFEAGRLGQKTGAGFFKYKDRKAKGEPDPEAEKLIASHVREKRTFTPEELTLRLFLPMLLEATRVLEEGIVRTPQDVDLGLIYGIGFPPFRGGLLFWADTLGAEKIVQQLEPFAPLGARYAPTRLLLEMAREGRKFYR